MGVPDMKSTMTDELRPASDLCTVKLTQREVDLLLSDALGFAANRKTNLWTPG